MIRYAILLLNMLGIFIYRLFVADGVTVKQNIPSNVKPGGEFTVEITINKGTSGGFAKLQQELPEGFTASAMDSKGASFNFSGNAVKFIWTSLPAEPEFKITYKVVVPANAPLGEKSIAGKFFYVVDNAKQSVDVEERKINIGDGTATAPAASTQTPDTQNPKPDTLTQEKNKSPETNAKVQETPQQNVSPQGGSETLNCTRKITPVGGNDYTVELSVNRANITGFGKIQENLPPGFSAIPQQNSGAAFSFSDQKVKLVWVNLPAETEFKVVYKITGTTSAKASVDGLFSYIENDLTKKFVIAATSIGGAEETAKTAEQVEQTPVKKDSNLISVTVPKNQTNVNYKVQICALRQTPVNVSYFTTRFGFNKVDTELNEGWTKYTTGGYNEYKEARDYREEAKSKGVFGPFVTAYNSGKRITVQEALMITSQKWFK